MTAQVRAEPAADGGACIGAGRQTQARRYGGRRRRGRRRRRQEATRVWACAVRAAADRDSPKHGMPRTMGWLRERGLARCGQRKYPSPNAPSFISRLGKGAVAGPGLFRPWKNRSQKGIGCIGVISVSSRGPRAGEGFSGRRNLDNRDVCHRVLLLSAARVPQTLKNTIRSLTQTVSI